LLEGIAVFKDLRFVFSALLAALFIGPVVGFYLLPALIYAHLL
jgi:hypothetical protein